MKILFSKFAKNELDDAVTFYETELAGLGRLFKEEIKSSVSRIKEHPEAWSIEKGDVRKLCFIDFLIRFYMLLKKIK
jgi:hypothetical protein